MAGAPGADLVVRVAERDVDAVADDVGAEEARQHEQQGVVERGQPESAAVADRVADGGAEGDRIGDQQPGRVARAPGLRQRGEFRAEGQRGLVDGLLADLGGQRGAQTADARVGVLEHGGARGPLAGAPEGGDGGGELGRHLERPVDLAGGQLLLRRRLVELPPGHRVALAGGGGDPGEDLFAEVLLLSGDGGTAVGVHQRDRQIVQVAAGVEDAAEVEQRHQQAEQADQDAGDHPDPGVAEHPARLDAGGRFGPARLGQGRLGLGGHDAP